MSTYDILMDFLEGKSNSGKAHQAYKRLLEIAKDELTKKGNTFDARKSINDAKRIYSSHWQSQLNGETVDVRSIPYDIKKGEIISRDSMRIVELADRKLGNIIKHLASNNNNFTKEAAVEKINELLKQLQEIREKANNLSKNGRTFFDRIDQENAAKQQKTRQLNQDKANLEKTLGGNSDDSNKPPTSKPRKDPTKGRVRQNPADRGTAKRTKPTKPQEFSLGVQNQAAKILARALKQAGPVLRKLKAEYPKQKFSSSAYTDIAFMIAAREAQSDLRNAKRSAVAECIEDAAARSGSSTAVKAAKLGRDAVANPQKYNAVKADTSGNAALGTAAEVVTAISGAGTGGMLAKGIWELLKALVVYTATSNRMSPGLN
jgi:hypothetical protein